jgi:hypothetical protein
MTLASALEIEEIHAAHNSFSVLEMLQMGKVLDNKCTTVITLHSFNFELMAWNIVPTTVEFVVEKEPLGVGPFHEARKATLRTPSVCLLHLGCHLNHTTKCRNKKTVQMHMLARNVVIQLKKSNGIVS